MALDLADFRSSYRGKATVGFRRTLVVTAALLLLVQPASAQMDSREGIALQNQILQLRQEMEQFRSRGGSAPAPSSRAPAGGGELVGSLLERVNRAEEEVRRMTGRVDVLENQNRRLREDLEKFQADMEYRLGQGGGASGGSRPASTPAAPAAPSGPPTTSTGAPAPRTPDRAIAEGQAALGRRDYAAAETAAREVLAARGATQAVAGQMLLADALMGKRDFGNAAIAYDAAHSRARTGPRAPEALLGLSNAFQGLGSRREACDTLNQLRSQFPTLPAPMTERVNAARQRGQCR